MTLLVEKGTFTKETSNVDGTDQTVTLANSSLTPKVVWLWSDQGTGSGSYAEHLYYTYGFSDGTRNACISTSAEDNQGNSDSTGLYFNNQAIAFSDIAAPAAPSVSSGSRGSVISFAAGSFTIDWAISDANAWNIHYMVMGGTDITNVFVLTTTAGTLSTGNRAYTGVGFQGDFMNMISSGVTTTAGASTTITPSIGAATSSSARWAFGAASSDGASVMIAKNNKEITRILTNWTISNGSKFQDADFVSFDSDGFTINWTDGASNANNTMAALVIKGGLWNVGNGTAPASTGNQTINTTSGRDAEGVMMFTWGDTTTASGATGEAHNRVTIGGGDNSLTMGCISVMDTDGADPSVCTRISLTNEILRSHTANATAASSTTLAAATLTNMGNDGNFVVNWGTTLSGMGYTWFAVSQTFAAGTQFNRSPSADSITVSDASTTRLLSALRLPSTDSITVTDSSLTRQTQAFRTVSPDTTTVADSSLVRSVTDVRATAADSTTVADSSLTRLLSAVRVPTTEVPALSESVTRMTQAFRSPSADTITAVDSSTIRSATRVRATAADDITIADSSLTRLLSAVRVPSSDSTTVLDSSLTRVLSLLRIPSADSITTSENVTGQYTQGTAVIERAPSAENITVADASLTRLLSSLRLPSSDAVTTGESLIRVLSAIRSPSTDTVVTADNATGLRSLLRTPASDSINVLDSSLTRRLSATRLPSQDTITITAGTATRMLSAIRLPSVEVISVGESLGAQVSGRISRSVSDTVIVDENLVRILQAFRVPPADTINLNEQLTRSRTAVRLTTADTTVVSEAALTRVLALTRSVSSDTTAIIESALTRVLQAFRNLQDTVTVSELVSLIGFSRSVQDTITVTEPALNRIVTAIRTVAPETVNVTESVFFQTFHKFVFDSVTVAEQLFKIRTGLSGSVTYAIPSEVRPLLGNIGPTQRTDEQIELAIDAAYDEINTKTNRIPPNDWKETDHNFGLVKKLTRYIAAKECAIGIKDFDTKPLEMEIEHLFNDLLTYDTSSDATQDIVGSSPDITYALNDAGLIWSVRYKNLRKGSAGENDTTTINPNT